MQQEMNGGAVAFTETRAVKDETWPICTHNAADFVKEGELQLHTELVRESLYSHSTQTGCHIFEFPSLFYSLVLIS
jgi:hypothetical protein